MARIPLIDENDPSLTTAQKKMLGDAAASRGKLLNLYRALGNRPEAATALMSLVQTVYRVNSTLQPKHGEFAYLTATAVNDCFY